MQDEDKTKEQLIIELHELRKRLAESEKNKAKLQAGGGGASEFPFTIARDARVHGGWHSGRGYRW